MGPGRKTWLVGMVIKQMQDSQFATQAHMPENSFGKKAMGALGEFWGNIFSIMSEK
jgi:hypothetical protein